MAEPTSGVSQSDNAALANDSPRKPNPPKKDPKITEREELLARMDSRVDNMRAEEDKYFLASADVDPRAAALAAQMAKEARGEPIASDKGHRDDGASGGEGEQPEPGTEYVEPVHAEEDDAAKRARAAVRISQKGEDPLGEYVVRVDGKPMFKTVVDGQEKLIPLESARTQLQKHLAADIRFEQAKQQRKELDARERSIRNVEATLRARSAAAATPAPAANDEALDREAVEVVRSLVTEPEDKAAARLAKTFKAIRQAAATAPVDPEAIANAAAERAVRTIAERDSQRALGEGLKTFTKNYPDIAGDSDLFNLADRKTDAIAQEHPDWSPEQVMMEAGKQTREWLRGLGGSTKEMKSNGGTPPQNNRQQLKQRLTPMPTPRSAGGAAPKDDNAEDSPQAAVAAMRKARGQAY